MRNVDDRLGCNKQNCGMPTTAPFLCDMCGRSIKSADGIFVDSFSPVLDSLLERIPYDEMHGVSIEASRGLGRGYIRLIGESADIRVTPELSTLELGSGSGLLSLGLFMNDIAENYIISDVSESFLRVNREKLIQHAKSSGVEAPAHFPTHMRCSVDNLPFRPGTFDLIVANSVLHHIFDYKEALSACKNLLKPGGCIAMSEPMVEGKVLQAFLANLIIEIDRRSGSNNFSDAAIRNASNEAIASKQQWWLDRAYIKKDTADDKHLFLISEMQDVGRALGFSGVDVLQVGSAQKSIRNMVSAIIGAGDQTALDKYTYVMEAAENLLLDQMGDSFYCHHALLVFKT